ncbi:MAG TPA: trehalase family glycosidase [Acidimicrobiia bacterium]|jgi:glycogen debranching enzyme
MSQSPTGEPSEHADATLVSSARNVLARNRRGAWTCPARGFYPHQWLWDSCFVAIGLATFDAPRAGGELRALFRGQWSNGLLPHMVFADEVRDAGSRHIWQSMTHPEAPRDVETSCITQPPLPAIAAERVAEALGADGKATLRDLYPRILAYHEWLYRERAPGGKGLVTLIHPWECGLDTTPPWIRELRRMRGPWWLRPALRLRLSRIARVFRRDTRYAPAAERLSDDDGLRMLALVHHVKREGFDLARLAPRTSVLVEDLAFNSLLVVANHSLERIAEALGETIDPALTARFRHAEVALDELWHEGHGQYFSRDASTNELITLPTLATFMPLWAGVVPPERRRRLVALLGDTDRYWPRFPVPSVPVDAKEFDANRYWRGPTWVNTNWIILEGLRNVGEHGLADELRERTLDLVEQSGFAEYFSALNGRGHGASEFSWTAALTLDLLARP